MQVEDPFDCTENCARSVHENSLSLICDAFASTTDALSGLQSDSELSWLRVCLFCWPQGSVVPGVRSKMQQQQHGQQYGQMYGSPNAQFRPAGYGHQFPPGRCQKGGWNQHQQLHESNRLDFLGTQAKGKHDVMGSTQAKSGLKKKMHGKLEVLPQSLGNSVQGGPQITNSALEEEPIQLTSANDGGDRLSITGKLNSVKATVKPISDKEVSLATVESQAPPGTHCDHLQTVGVNESSGEFAVATSSFPQVYKTRERHRNRGRRKGKQHELIGQSGPLEDPSFPSYDVNASRNSQQGRQDGSPAGTSLRVGEVLNAQRSQTVAGAPQNPGIIPTSGKTFRRNKQHFPRWAKKTQEMGTPNPSLSNTVTVMGDQGGPMRQDGQMLPRRNRILVGPGVPDSKLCQSSSAH